MSYHLELIPSNQRAEGQAQFKDIDLMLAEFSGGQVNNFKIHTRIYWCISAIDSVGVDGWSTTFSKKIGAIFGGEVLVRCSCPPLAGVCCAVGSPLYICSSPPRCTMGLVGIRGVMCLTHAH